MVTIIAATVPDPPLAPTLVSSTKTQISIEWTLQDNGGSTILNYSVLSKEVGSAGLFTDITADGTLDVVARTFTTDSTLTTGTSFYFKVVATNAVGDSLESEQSSGMIAAVTPSAPSNLQKLASTRDTISVQW